MFSQKLTWLPLLQSIQTTEDKWHLSVVDCGYLIQCSTNNYEVLEHQDNLESSSPHFHLQAASQSLLDAEEPNSPTCSEMATLPFKPLMLIPLTTYQKLVKLM